MRFDLDALSQIGGQTVSDGTLLQIPVEDIDEDPAQPRQEFEPEPLQQLAGSIAKRGLLQAISVKRHPEQPGRWMLNFGARRLRACRLAGLPSIAATVNETVTSYDQVIENEHREGLKPLELAMFVRSRIALGESQTEIARLLVKSQPYITYLTALIDAPDWLIVAYQEGKCRGMAELYHLRRLHAQAPQRVQAWIDQQPSISRSDLQRLRLELGDDTDGPKTTGSIEAGPGANAVPPALPVGRAPVAEGSPSAPPPAAASAPTASAVRMSASRGEVDCAGRAAARPAAIRLLAEFEGQAVEVVVDSAPAEQGRVFVRAPGAVEAKVVAARDLRLVGFEPARRT